MPYSNDRTIVSATDDVRIFDIEHSGHSALGSSGRSRAQGQHSSARRQREDVTLTAGDTNEQAFRSHGDTVKRIVTEDNPFYFLTCSNDGDVRQWDIRQPSKAYPPAAAESVPPPLISYSRYGLDLNTVSCSPSQPHYIALGGAHLHCFLHDRRMLGRDVNRERGSRLSSPANWNDNDDELLGQATQCVKKFAPNGKQHMRRNDGGHITACKISDASPNELIVSWSQDHIYGFDIQRSPDAREKVQTSQVSSGDSSGRVKDKSRKRKRPKSSVLSQEAADRAGSRQRTQSSDEDLALRVTYGNGQSEDIRIEAPAENRMSQEELAEIRGTEHFRIARTVVKIKKRLSDMSDLGESGLHLSFTSILGFAHSILSDMDDLARSWGYPVDPDPVDVVLQNTLRDNRAASRRFVQAAGTLSRVMGGQLLIGSRSDDLIAEYFASVQHAPRERELPQHEQFGYDFVKAILLWLDSGPSAVVEGFSSRSGSSRLPIPQDSDMDAIDDILIPYLLDLASDDPVINIDASRFETDDLRIAYPTEGAAVLAFAEAVKVPFADLTGAQGSASSDGSARYEQQERQTAKWHWGFKVARGVLFNAAKDIKFATVDRAFGGLGVSDATIRAEERTMREQQADIDPLDDSDDEFDEADFVSRALLAEASNEQAEGDEDEDVVMDENDEDEDDDEDSDDSDGDVDDSEQEDDDDETGSEDDEGLRRTRSGRLLWRSDFGRRRDQRERVGRDIPCTPHTRVYRGHCNVKTVKDVNYFGLQDEYVVSGSDSGHVFVWDRKTAELINILEGDGEVVNVVQGRLLGHFCCVPTVTNTAQDIHTSPLWRFLASTTRSRSFRPIFAISTMRAKALVCTLRIQAGSRVLDGIGGDEDKMQQRVTRKGTGT
jgi:nuclear receptor interaction protein